MLRWIKFGIFLHASYFISLAETLTSSYEESLVEFYKGKVLSNHHVSPHPKKKDLKYR